MKEINTYDFWEKRYSSNPSYRNLFPFSSVVSVLAQLRTSGPQKVLELGCGSGCNLWAAAEFGYNCYGIDVSPTIIEFARLFLKERGLHADLQVMRFEEINQIEHDFDLIIDRSSIHCEKLEMHKEIIKLVSSKIKPGGYFFFNPAGNENSSFDRNNESFPLEYVSENNKVFGYKSLITYYDENSIHDILKDFEVVELKKVIAKQICDGVEKFKYSEFEVLCKKPSH